MAVFDQQNYPNVNFYYFCHKNLGLDPDWIRISNRLDPFPDPGSAK
jgi:hypothetical protein